MVSHSLVLQGTVFFVSNCQHRDLASHMLTETTPRDVLLVCCWEKSWNITLPATHRNVDCPRFFLGLPLTLLGPTWVFGFNFISFSVLLANHYQKQVHLHQISNHYYVPVVHTCLWSTLSSIHFLWPMGNCYNCVIPTWE